MADRRQLEFFLLRYVPDAVKDEFVNIGVVMVEPGANGGGFAEVRFTRDWRRVRCLDPQADVEMLEALEREIRGQLATAHDRESFAATDGGFVFECDSAFADEGMFGGGSGGRD